MGHTDPSVVFSQISQVAATSPRHSGMRLPAPSRRKSGISMQRQELLGALMNDDECEWLVFAHTPVPTMHGLT